MRSYHQLSRRTLGSGFAALLAVSSPCAPALAVQRCSFAAIEGLPALLSRVSNAGLRNDVPGARALLSNEPLLADPTLLSSTLDACTPGADTRTVMLTLTELREELDFQVAKGVSDPRWRDADDTADLQRCTLKARSALQRYVDFAEKSATSGDAAKAALRLRGGYERAAPRNRRATCKRRAFIRRLAVAAAYPTAHTTLAADAYDSIPTAVAPDPAAMAAERAKIRREREARAAAKNAEVARLCDRVSAATAAAEFEDAMDALSLWVIAQGKPLCSGACQWTTAEDRSPLPEGFKTRELVAACKAALAALPRVSYACEMTRENRGVCFSAGPQAERAYQAFIVELKKRAPLQYDTPYGLVAF